MAFSLGQSQMSQQPIAETVGRGSEEMPTLWIASETADWETTGNKETAGQEHEVTDVAPTLENAETAGRARQEMPALSGKGDDNFLPPARHEVTDVAPTLDNAETAGRARQDDAALGKADIAQDQDDNFLPLARRMTRTKACILLWAIYATMISCTTVFALVWILAADFVPDEVPTWVKVYNLNLDVHTSELFAVAFHWAISKFTLSSVEPTLTPQNGSEKILDFIGALIAVFLTYPLLGAVVALIAKQFPLFPSAEATRKQLAIRLLILGSALILQWVLFAVMWMEVPGSQRDLEIGKPVVGQPTSEFTSVFRHSAEKDVAHGLHWSLCQFSLASLTIVPPSYEERVAAIFVQLIGFWTMYPLIAAATWTAFRLFPQSLRPYAL
eukprot:TRINITY_DN7090_c0_g1_i9.p1 TRINITY_DN7090_c0_g1~~TRINITY_DN7090_c0_g1_i9.p1  ORF type:complete len:385 (-),score=42.99 TRINITY_DN7090_c0_g1_i9:197-1351(-)